MPYLDEPWQLSIRTTERYHSCAQIRFYLCELTFCRPILFNCFRTNGITWWYQNHWNWWYHNESPRLRNLFSAWNPSNMIMKIMHSQCTLKYDIACASFRSVANSASQTDHVDQLQYLYHLFSGAKPWHLRRLLYNKPRCSYTITVHRKNTARQTRPIGALWRELKRDNYSTREKKRETISRVPRRSSWFGPAYAGCAREISKISV